MVAGCPRPPSGDGDGMVTGTVQGTSCGAAVIACYDEFARQPARLICFREQSRWNRTALTWELAEPLESIAEQDQVDAIERALSLWSSASSLTFARGDGGGDIEIRFVGGEHDDPFPFDGPGDNLGHAFFPGSPRPGEVHICSQEPWSLNPAESEKDLFTVLLHEIGHALGLEHSWRPEAVMSASYRAGVTELSTVDIEAIQLLYGNAGGTVPPIIERPEEFAAYCSDVGNLTAADDPDTDDDGIPDTIEVFVLGSEALEADSDGDGADDFDEVIVSRTDPVDAGDVFAPGGCRIRTVTFVNADGTSGSGGDGAEVTVTGSSLAPTIAWSLAEVFGLTVARPDGTGVYGIETETGDDLPTSISYGDYSIPGTTVKDDALQPAGELVRNRIYRVTVYSRADVSASLFFELLGSGCPAPPLPPPVDMPDGDGTDDDGTLPTFVDAVITHEGAEHLFAGPAVDSAVSFVTPAGYAIGNAFTARPLALSGDGALVWVGLYDEFPDVSGDPQTQLWVIHTDGTGGQRSDLPDTDLRNGVNVATSVDGSVAIVDNTQTTDVYRATPGSPVATLFGATELAGSCIRGAMHLSDDGSRLVYASFCDTSVYAVDLAAAPATPVRIATPMSFLIGGLTASSLESNIDATATGDSWLVVPSAVDSTRGIRVYGLGFGSGVVPGSPVVGQEPPTADRAIRGVQLSDDGGLVGYCQAPVSLGAVQPCYTQAAGSPVRSEIGDGISTVGDLSMSDDGFRVYVRSNIESAGGYGYVAGADGTGLRLSGSQRFSGAPTPAFSRVQFSDNGALIVAAVPGGLYALHDSTPPPGGFPTIDAIGYRFDDENCLLKLRVTVSSPLGVERIFTLPMFNGREPTAVVPGEENPLFVERSGGGVNWSTVFTQSMDDPAVWERDVPLTNSVGACAADLLDGSYELRIVLVEATGSRTAFKDFSPAR